MKPYKITFHHSCDYPSRGTTYSLIVMANSAKEAKDVALEFEDDKSEEDIWDWHETNIVDTASWNRKRKPQVVFR